MTKVREELRQQLFDLRIQLQMAKMERIDSNERVNELQQKIKDVKKQMTKEIVEERENDKNGKKIQ